MLKADFAGLSFSAISKVRQEFLDSAAQLFDNLVGGQDGIHHLYIDSDPFHDSPPRRRISLSASIAVVQEPKK